MTRLRWASKDARDIVKFAEEFGLKVGVSRGNHLRIFNEAGRVIMHTGAILSPRNVHNARAQIRRAVRQQKEQQ